MWGCTEFLHQAHMCPSLFPIFVQHHLRDVTLDLPSVDYSNKLHLVKTSRLDSLRTNNVEYPNPLMWNKYPIRLTIVISRSDGLVPHLCCHHSQPHSRKHLHLHVPEKPIQKGALSTQMDLLMQSSLQGCSVLLKQACFARHPPCKHSTVASLDLTL